MWNNARVQEWPHLGAKTHNLQQKVPSNNWKKIKDISYISADILTLVWLKKKVLDSYKSYESNKRLDYQGD